MASLFSKIVKGEIPCYKVAETNDYLAFLDIFPLKQGHTLVIPKKETDYIFDIDDQQLAGLHVFSKQVARAIEKVVPCKRIGVAVIGLEVPHAHIHLVPMNEMSDINFERPKLKLPPNEMERLAQAIQQAFKAL
ncbi:MAG: HIT family protein [Bacteroidetes bacterium]|nr:HIT family protein [Bacteroidota bacterium]